MLVRLLGGYDWWAYGCDRLAALARERGIALALLPGECREADARLAALSTVPEAEQAALLACFREGGPENMRRAARAAGAAGRGGGRRRRGAAGAAGRGARRGRAAAAAGGGRRRRGGRWCRSCSIARCCSRTTMRRSTRWRRRWRREGIEALPVFVPSLRDAARGGRGRAGAARGSAPAAIVTATAFAAAEGEASLFDRLGVPVFQVVPATTRREAWEGGARGLAPADLAMHVVLPELDGRVLAGAVSFKDAGARDERFGLGLQVNRPEPDRVAQVARRIAALLRLRGDAAGGAAAGDPDPGLSGGGGADRLCGRARRAGERAGDARRPARRRATRSRTCRRRRAS